MTQKGQLDPSWPFRRARHLLRIGRLHHVHSVEPPHGHVTVLPLHTRALALDLRRNPVSDFPEILRLRERLGGEAAEDHIGGHESLLLRVTGKNAGRPRRRQTLPPEPPWQFAVLGGNLSVSPRRGSTPRRGAGVVGASAK